MTFLLLATLAQISATIAAEKLALRRPEHRPVARALGLLTGASLLRACMGVSVLASPGPYSGWARVAFHVEEALFLVTPVAMAWLPWATLEKFPLWIAWGSRIGSDPTWVDPVRLRRVRADSCISVAAWAILSAVCVLAYPDLRGEALGKFYLGAQLVALFVSCGALITWARRGDWREFSPTVLSVLAILGVEFLSLLTGPWTRDLFGQAWEAEQGSQLALYSALTLLQLAAFLTADRRP